MFPLILVICALVLVISWLTWGRSAARNEALRVDHLLRTETDRHAREEAACNSRVRSIHLQCEAAIRRVEEQYAYVQLPPTPPAFPPPPPMQVPADFALKMAAMMGQVVKEALNPTDHSVPEQDQRRNVTQMAGMAPLPYPDDTDPNEWLVDPAMMRDDIVVLGPDEDEPWGVPGLKLPDEVMHPGGWNS